MVIEESNINEIFKIIVESSYDGIYVTDGQANTIFFNKSYENITQLPREKLIGNNMKNLVEKGYFDESGSLKAIQTRKEVTLNQKLKSGKNIFVTSTPVFNSNGEIIYVVTNVRDMRKLEELEKKLLESKKMIQKYKKEIDLMKKDVVASENFITNNIKMQKILNLMKDVAKYQTSILLQGETGTGKTYLAKLIHEFSSRKNESFYEINCGALPESLVESELFGYEKGAFTGALSNGKKGIFEIANKSTLFLDEISELSLGMQAKLLKILETGSFFRIGGEKTINTDVRIICASNRNLVDMINEGKFRKDLYYRINTIMIEIPPIKERKEDIIPLIVKFLRYYNKKYNIDKNIPKDILNILEKYDWPGNIREIKNTIEHMVIVSKNPEIDIDDIPGNIFSKIETNLNLDLEYFCNCCLQVYSKLPLKVATKKFQEDIIELLLKKGNSKSKIAKLLSVNPSTITRKFSKK